MEDDYNRSESSTEEVNEFMRFIGGIAFAVAAESYGYDVFNLFMLGLFD